MKHTFSLFVLAAATTLFSSCKKEAVPYNNINNPDKISFDNLAIGQKSTYLELIGEDYYNHSTENFVYTDDTLSLEIINQDANGFLVEERAHYTGTVSNWLEHEKDSVYHYYFKVENDTLKIKPKNNPYLQSRIFGYHVGQTGLPLAEYTNNTIAIQGWLTSVPYCECYHDGYTTNYTLFDETYDRLNVIVQDSPMALDGNGETYLWSKEHGLVRFVTYSWWTSTGHGWNLLP